MKTRIAVLADYAGLSIEHKLNILGIFTTLSAPRIPAVHAQMKVVTQFAFDPGEAGLHALRIVLVDADGQELLSLSAEFLLQPAQDGRSVMVNQIFDLTNLSFLAFGDYEFRVLVDDETVAEIPLTVVPSAAHAS